MQSDNSKVESAMDPYEISGLTISPHDDHGVDFQATLLAMAGHDLRQPLQVLQNVQDRFNNGLRTSAELRLLKANQTAIDAMTRQLNQLLEALRVGEHGKQIQLSPVKLGALLDDARREHAAAALEKGVQFRQVPTQSCVMSDVLLLTAVVRNLVDNAIKYTRPGGRILLGCRHAGHIVRIDLLDTGIGISSEHMATVFEAFTRVDAAQGRGLGVGLFIVRQAIAILGHQISVSSVANRGTRFSIFARSAMPLNSSSCSSSVREGHNRGRGLLNSGGSTERATKASSRPSSLQR
jgi:two-component system, OmpR family, phosphate regulon sensor histidine kinase PhoR